MTRISPCVLQITRRRKDGIDVPKLSGMYLLNYNPQRDADDCYYLTVTDDRSEAKVFDNRDQALEYYCQTSKLLNNQISQPLAEEYHIAIVFLPVTHS
jgi:hypothetical protein